MLCVPLQVGRVYPQAVYFPIRTLYLTLKIEQRERYKSGTSRRGHRAGWVGYFYGPPVHLLQTHSCPVAG